MEEKDLETAGTRDLSGSPEGKKPKKEEKQKSTLRNVLDYVLWIAVAVAIALFVNSFILLNARIPSGSMENTIMTGDRVFGFRLAYLFSDPQRGDIVIFKYPDDESENFIKRIIGLPGETLEIKEGVVYIDGEPLDEPYLKETPMPENLGPYEIPEGYYFMMGDNRNNSKDSRRWNNTYVARDKNLAKAVWRYWKGFKIFHHQSYD